MAASALLSDLARLTGEEVYHLVNMLDRHQIRLVELCTAQLLAGDADQGLSGVLIDLVDIRQDALMQIARITIPLDQAAAIVYRVQYLRHGQVPMTADATSSGRPRI